MVIDEEKYNKIKVVMMGNSDVGKSSITQRYVNRTFSEIH